jgi:hypothetical protein
MKKKTKKLPIYSINLLGKGFLSKVKLSRICKKRNNIILLNLECREKISWINKGLLLLNGVEIKHLNPSKIKVFTLIRLKTITIIIMKKRKLKKVLCLLVWIMMISKNFLIKRKVDKSQWIDQSNSKNSSNNYYLAMMMKILEVFDLILEYGLYYLNYI